MIGSGALLAAVFLSGLLSLVYQIVWTRLFYPVFGMSLGALTAVVAAFMGGLGLGAHLFGRRADRGNPWTLFAMLQAGIALFGIVLPSLTRPAAALFALLTPPGAPAPLVHLVRIVGVALLLAGPCVLMGGTFPAFVRGFAASGMRLGRDLGGLYALNTAGAACGALSAGVGLLPHLGMDWISRAAALGNVLIAIVAWRAGAGAARRAPGDDAASGAAGPSAASTRVGSSTGRGALLGLLFLTGYLGLSFELLWTRALTQALGATYLSFSMILAAMLLGIVLGSMAYRAFLADREHPAHLPVLMVLLFLAALASFLVVARLHPLLAALRGVLGLARSGPASSIAGDLALSLVAFLPTCVLSGAIFPLGLRLLAAGRGRLGRDLGVAYGVNTAGAVAGVVLSGVVTIGWIGSGGTLRLLLFLAAAAVGLAFRATRPRLPRLVPAGAILLALAAAAVFPGDVFYANQLACLSDLLPREIDVLFRAEDATSMATLVEMPKVPFHYLDDGVPREGTQRNIWHSNWLGVGGTRIYLWNVTGAYLAGMLHPDPGDILVIGYGSGRQIATLLGLPWPRHVDVVEISPLNIAASDFFYLDSRRMLADPRVVVHVDDGRNYLLRSRARYDVILVDVGGLGSEGSEFFYTREFLGLCRAHLRPGGRVFTWMDIRNVVEPLGGMYRATLRTVFPDVSLWLGTGEATSYGWMWLVGGESPMSVDAPLLRRRWDGLTPAQQAELGLAGVNEPMQLLALHWTDLAGGPGGTGGAAAGTERVLTDVRPYAVPVWDLERAPGSWFATPHAFAEALGDLMRSGRGLQVVDATPAERDALEGRRRDVQVIVATGSVRGPFRIRSEATLRPFFP